LGSRGDLGFDLGKSEEQITGRSLAMEQKSREDSASPQCVLLWKAEEEKKNKKKKIDIKAKNVAKELHGSGDSRMVWTGH